MQVMTLGRKGQLMRQGGHEKRELTKGQDIAAAPQATAAGDPGPQAQPCLAAFILKVSP